MAVEQKDAGVENPGKMDNDLSSPEPSPRGVLENQILRSDSDNSRSSNSSSGSHSSSPKKPANKEGSGLQWRNMFDNIKKESVKVFSVIPIISSYEYSMKNLRKKLARFQGFDEEIDPNGFSVPKPSWKNFTYAELAIATDNFSSKNLVGKGGHAEVYKGCLSDGKVVAVKKLMKVKNEENRVSDFLSELGIIAHINHPNAARLIGFSIEGGLHLILQFSPHGSLASLLFGTEECLDWKRRFKVAVGVAEGLHYLHHDCPRRIIHRDIKASNILLTDDYDAQISDFGLAKWLPENWNNHVVHPIEGTFGYLAPEYFMHGIVDEKTDVFAYGVLLLELITGHRAVDSSRQSLVIWAKPLLETSNVKELVDSRLEDEYDVCEFKRAMLTALMCINHVANKRPNMERALQLLKGEEGPQETQQKPVRKSMDFQDYTCTSTYLNDLNRHMQLVME